MDEIIKKAFLKAVDIDDINKKFAEEIIDKLEKKVGLKAVKALINKWSAGAINLYILLKILDIGLDELRFVVRELKLMNERKFDSLISRDISIRRDLSSPSLSVKESEYRFFYSNPTTMETTSKYELNVSTT
ncbi:MAG: hypothetical protein ACP6IS_11610 [Candidatus Asgardarchaeia archaeon]